MPASRRGQCDGGFATVVAAGGVAAMLAVHLMLLWFACAMVARQRAGAVADLAALAAAAHARAGVDSACAKAEMVADRMRARIDSCLLEGWDARVEASVDPAGFLARFGSVAARARAGPVDVAEVSR